MSEIRKYAIVGTGVRSAFWYGAIITDFPKIAKLVAICDINQTRMNVANDRMAGLGGQRVPTYKSEDFDKMIHETSPDTVIVTTIDRVHHKYCIRAMELGCNAITEKPMTIDEEKLQAMIDSVHQTGHEVRVAFNYRYAPHNTKVRELIADGVIGEVTSTHFDWILDTQHGGDFFRRWHRSKVNSGGLLLHKSIHHFDLMNFWLDTQPDTVYCLGDLRFYGRENAEKRGITKFYHRTHGSENAKGDPFALYLENSAQLKALYLDAEHEDGYFRDQSVFGDGISIEDNLSMMVKYQNKAVMTYNTYAYAPWEGFRCVFNGTKGRLEITVREGHYIPGGEKVTNDAPSAIEAKYIQGGVEEKQIIVYPMFDKPYEVEIPEGKGGHGGGDPVMLDDVFGGRKADKFNRASFIREGANAVLVGIGGNISMRTGQPVKVQDLVHWYDENR